MSLRAMNSSSFNQSCIVDEGGVDGVLNDNFISLYLNTMINKHCKAVSTMINVELDDKYLEAMVQCKKYMHALKRVTEASELVEKSKFLEGERNSLSSLSDVSDDVVSVMNPLRNEFEKSLNQLPSKGFQMLSSTQQLDMKQKLKGCNELLEKYHKHFSEELTESSILVQNLQKTLAPELLQRKEKCDSLMEAISNTAIQETAHISAKTANAVLEEKEKTKIIFKVPN